MQKAALVQHDRDRDDVLAGSTPRHPYLHGGESTQPRDDLLAEVLQRVRLSEHAGDVHAGCVQEALERFRVVEDSFLVARDRWHAFQGHAHDDVAAEGTRSIVAEVIAVMERDSLQQQLNLDRLQARVDRSWFGRHGIEGAQLVSQARSIESRWVLLTGLAM